MDNLTLSKALAISNDPTETVEPLLVKHCTVLQSNDRASLQPTLDLKPHWRSEATKYELKGDSKQLSKILGVKM